MKHRLTGAPREVAAFARLAVGQHRTSVAAQLGQQPPQQFELRPTRQPSWACI